MTDHFKKTATAVVVVLICFEMLRELVYTSGKNSDLYLGRARVALMSFVTLKFRKCKGGNINIFKYFVNYDFNLLALFIISSFDSLYFSARSFA